MGDFQVEYLDGEEETVNFVKRAGKAKVTYANGDIFEGEFDDRKLKTKGTYTFSCLPDPEAEEEPEEQQGPCKYIGEFTDGQRTGNAKMIFSDGSMYRGEFVQGLAHGIGSYTYVNGDIYSGSFENGKRHGKGTYLFKDSKCRMEGIWENGEPADGKFVHPDGTVYSGGFQKQAYGGKCSFSFPSGIEIAGEFYNLVDKVSNRECHRWQLDKK